MKPATAARNRPLLASAALVSLFAGFTGPARTLAHAEDTLTCKDRVVSLGDAKYDVSALCGTPDSVERRVETRSVRRRSDVPCRVGNGITRCPALVDDTVEITIEEWVYDFGPNRFVQYLTFEQGKLLQIRQGNYGHKPL